MVSYAPAACTENLFISHTPCRARCFKLCVCLWEQNKKKCCFCSQSLFSDHCDSLQYRKLYFIKKHSFHISINHCSHFQSHLLSAQKYSPANTHQLPHTHFLLLNQLHFLSSVSSLSLIHLKQTSSSDSQKLLTLVRRGQFICGY